jgi:hypothetical protein
LDGLPRGRWRAVAHAPADVGQVRLLRAARANLDFGADEKRIRTKIKVIDKSKGGLVFIHDPRLRTDALFIRTQSRIRADGSPSAQAPAPAQLT